MSSSSRRSSSSNISNISKGGRIDPITRTALRYTISPREYELLHAYLISRAPAKVQKKTPSPPRYEKITASSSEGGDYNTAAVRAALRVFVGLYSVLKGIEVVTGAIAKRRGGAAKTVNAAAVGPPRYKNARVALSFSSILLFHRLLHRFFLRIRSSLQEDNAAPFRRRNPGITKALTSKYTPALGASLAGFLLGLSPSDQMRVTIAIYALSRSLEYGYNALAENGYIWGKDSESRPWWFGSWMLVPFTCGQLLHAFVFDRDCFPEAFGAFILKRSPEYIQIRPADYPSNKPWPYTFDIVDGLAEISKLKWPPFVSPILFPNNKQTLPGSIAVQRLAPITAPAHPGTKHTSCAILHPHDPSCARTYLKYWITAFPAIAKFFTLFYGAFALLGYKSLIAAPAPFLNRVSKRILAMSIFVAGSIGTSWGSICLFHTFLPRTTLPTQRWFLGGFLGGMWAFVARHRERANFMYSLRMSMDSLWKVGKKHGWWRGVKNGDVLVFVASLALVDFVYEKNPGAVQGKVIRKGMGMLRGDGWVDRAEAVKEVEEEEEKKLQ
ncbi:unnamed protein product [Zymoseptoria tritici ST99CH_1A5]|uniref:Transmembrane protein 135 N-terminal domain-containing protein n=1 Tax=Zymoseptoria tritici ST99CH_1A5 TaxID=1276529 RepID=A0A1Y6LFT9_ZYMTR|nr:unnamed protein product [Zymoseptoria tritici ST99CH_1A5]